MPKEIEEPTPVPDLMAALRESLQAAREQTPQQNGGRIRGGRGALASFTREELYDRARDVRFAGVPR